MIKKQNKSQVWTSTLCQFLRLILLANDDVYMKMIPVIKQPINEILNVILSSQNIDAYHDNCLDKTTTEWFKRLNKFEKKFLL